MATITEIPNNVSGLTFRTTMNDNFAVLNAEKSEVTHTHPTLYADIAYEAQVDTNTADITALQAPQDSVAYNPQVTPPAYQEGLSYYNDATKTFDVYGPYAGITLSPGHNSHMHVINNSGFLIEKGMAVRHNGVAGGIVQIEKALADSFENARVLGVTEIDIPNGAESAITTFGEIKNLDTSLLPNGVPLFLSDTVPGTYSATAPDIVTQVGGALTSDALDGVLYVSLVNNKNVPTVFGGMQGQTTGGVYNLTAVVQDIINYDIEENILVTTDVATGVVTVPNDGQYRMHFTSSMSFVSSTSTRTVYLELYDITNAIVRYTYTKNIPRDATEDGLSFSFPINALANGQYKIRVSSVPDMTITLDEVSFDIQSVNIR